MSYFYADIMAFDEKVTSPESKGVLVDTAKNDATSESVDITPTVDQDEALKVINKEHGTNEWDAREEKSLLWKIDRKLFSLILISYVCPCR